MNDVAADPRAVHIPGARGRGGAAHGRAAPRPRPGDRHDGDVAVRAGAAVHRGGPQLPRRPLAAGRDRDRERAPVPGGPGGARGRRRRERVQERVPRHDEPRDPHADERDHRDERPAERDRARRGTTRVRDDDLAQRRRAPHDHQRHPRLLEDRGRADGARVRAVRRARVPGVGRRPDRPDRPAQGHRGHVRDRARDPRDRRGRREPAAPDPAEPAEQRGEVHRRGDRRPPVLVRSRDARSRHLRGRDPRHRDRDPAGPDRPTVPVVHAGRRLDEPPVRRDGPRPRDQPPARRADGRHGHGARAPASPARAARSA